MARLALVGCGGALTLRLTADANAGDHVATLNVQASSCADQPLHLHAAIAADSPDAGADAPDASVVATSPGQASKGGGCSSGAAPTGILAIIALAAALTARRRRPDPRR